MILRKPYALLIKYFRLIHMILLILTGYLFFTTNPISNIFSVAVNNQAVHFGRELVLEFFSPMMYFAIILNILISLAILWLMIAKKKPYLFYIYNIAIYISLFILLLISQDYFAKISNLLVDVIVLGNLRDFNTIATFLQIIALVILLVRSTGFDIKKFNFKDDIEELDVKEEDREEIELQVEFDFNKIIVRFKKNIRYFKYFVLEHKLLINVVIAILILSTTAYLYATFSIFNHSFNEKNMMIVGDINVIVNKSYITSNSYLNDLIFEDSKLVVVSVSLKSAKEMSLDLKTTNLKIGSSSYTPLKTYDSYLLDFGVSYNQEKLTSEYQDYLLVYRIDKEVDVKDAKVVFVDYLFNNNKNLTRQFKVALKPVILDQEIVKETKYTNEEFNIKDNPSIKDCTLNVVSFSVDPYLELPYNLCLNNGSCYESREILRPKLNSYEKTILSVNANGTCPVTKLLTTYGMIEYMYQDKLEVTRNIGELKPIKAKINGTYYFEIPLKASEITKIRLTIRNFIYEYQV